MLLKGLGFLLKSMHTPLVFEMFPLTRWHERTALMSLVDFCTLRSWKHVHGFLVIA